MWAVTNILLIEDDDAIAAPLVRVLSREGYIVNHVSTGKAGIEALGQACDLLILDLGLPDMEGLDVARKARSRGLTFPILILTARSDEVDMVVGLDAGADDYITKPFRLAELLARVRALLRRNTHADASGGMLRVQDLALNLAA
ncbi:MAG: response regulator transcription factor, partial [Actinomycetaceae bacterium]|nr:response regulator transcription factor [Actinomycetaceae bacterium]